MSKERFIELVEEFGGFEFIQAFGEDVDRIIGGKSDIFWHIVSKNSGEKESYIATYRDGIWKDHFIKNEGRKYVDKEMSPGTTINLIEEHAFIYQDETWVQKKTPSVVKEPHARCYQKVREERGSFCDYIWAYSGGKTILYQGHDVGTIQVGNGLTESAKT